MISFIPVLYQSFIRKGSVPEPRKSSSVSGVFGFLYAYEHYECFMYENILVVFLDVDMLHMKIL